MSSKDDHHHVDDQEKVLYISFNQDYGTFVVDTRRFDGGFERRYVDFSGFSRVWQSYGFVEVGIHELCVVVYQSCQVKWWDCRDSYGLEIFAFRESVSDRSSFCRLKRCRHVDNALSVFFCMSVYLFISVKHSPPRTKVND